MGEILLIPFTLSTWISEIVVAGDQVTLDSPY